MVSNYNIYLKRKLELERNNNENNKNDEIRKNLSKQMTDDNQHDENNGEEDDEEDIEMRRIMEEIRSDVLYQRRQNIALHNKQIKLSEIPSFDEYIR